MPFGLATEPDLDGWDWRMVEAFARSMGDVDDLPALKLLMDEAGRRRPTAVHGNAGRPAATVLRGRGGAGRGIVTPMTQDRDILAEAAVALPHNTKQRES